MKLFMDTDIIIKLSVHHLLDKVPAAFGCKAGDVYVLSTAKYQVKTSRYSKQYPGAAILKVRNFVENQPPIPDPSRGIREILGNVHNIDAGEVILFGAACKNHDSLVLTDDKKSLRALHFSQDCSEICNALKNRCFTLSLVVLKLIEHYGLDKVRNQISLHSQGEKLVIDAFAKNSRAGLENVLKADLLKLKHESGDLLGKFT